MNAAEAESDPDFSYASVQAKWPLWIAVPAALLIFFAVLAGAAGYAF